MPGKTRPRMAIVGYGSLLQPSELRELAPGMPDRAIPVKIEGFRRVFDQRTSRRTDDDVECAVANVVRSADSWTNGVLLPDVTRAEFEEFRERERWYRLVEVPPGDIEPYDTADASSIEAQDVVLTTTGLETDTDIEPIPEYVDACLEGAAEWGETFREDFLETTETNAGSLTDFPE